MTYLRIEQSEQAVENVSESLIKKLYDTALEISEPEEGEEDNAYMSGHISVPHSYRLYVEYLAGSIGEGTSGVVTSLTLNVEGRFLDLRVDVTNGYYIPFEDPAVKSILVLLHGDGLNITEAQAATALGGINYNDYWFSNNQNIQTFPEFPLFTYANNHGGVVSFYNSSIKSVDLSLCKVIPRFEMSTFEDDVYAPNATSFDGEKCFYRVRNLKSATNLGSVTSIPRLTFAGTWYCNGKINLPSTCTSIGDLAFMECGTHLSINFQYITSLGENIFYDAALLPYVENYNLTYVPNGCFQRCNILTFDFSNIATIGDNSFYGKTRSQLSGITLNIPNLTSLGSNAFRNTGIVGVTDLGSVTTISAGCFQYCTNLTSVTIPSTCTTIGLDAFRQCSALNFIELSANISAIGKQAFWDSGITTFVFRGTSVPTFTMDGVTKFKDSMGSVTIYVPESALNDYKTAWPDMQSQIVKIEGSVYDT